MRIRMCRRHLILTRFRNIPESITVRCLGKFMDYRLYHYATAVAKFLDLRKQGKPLTIHGDGEQTRDMTYVGDVVQANILAMEKGEGIYNIGGGHQYSVNKIADWISANQQQFPPRPAEARHTLADIGKAREELGWNPTVDLRSWINK